jgi:hypothetical protein
MDRPRQEGQYLGGVAHVPEKWAPDSGKDMREMKLLAACPLTASLG